MLIDNSIRTEQQQQQKSRKGVKIYLIPIIKSKNKTKKNNLWTYSFWNSFLIS